MSKVTGSGGTSGSGAYTAEDVADLQRKKEDLEREGADSALAITTETAKQVSKPIKPSGGGGSSGGGIND